jgi:phenylpropionate dioxygenase-like ring-hydroxylating dioxygenase large terminal subunit
VVSVVASGAEYVVWRGHSGCLGSAPRSCPHLDTDLADGTVVGDELVCPTHGWSFDCAGRAFKRNEFGREDDKGTVDQLTLEDTGPGADGEVVILDAGPAST